MTERRVHARTLGLIGGMSWESSAVYYRLLNQMMRQRLGGQHSCPLILHSLDFAEIAALQEADDWGRAGEMLVASANGLKAAGAEGLVLATNTMHRVADRIVNAAALPLLHIADATGAALSRQGSKRPLLLGTRYTMEGGFYAEHLRERHGIEPTLPDESGREAAHGIIYEELCQGRVEEASRATLLDIARRGIAAGADAVILGCTELGMLLSDEDAEAAGAPILDTTRLHCEAAVRFCLGETVPVHRPAQHPMDRPHEIRGRAAFLVPEQDQ